MIVLRRHIRNWSEPLVIGVGLSTITALLMIVGRSYAPFLLGGIGVGVFVLAVFFRYPSLMVIGYLISTTLFLDDEVGLPPSELIFLAYNLLIIGIFVVPEMIRGGLKPQNLIDKTALLLHLLVLYALILGFLNNAPIYSAVGGTVYYAGFLTFFAFRRYIHRDIFRKILFTVFLGLIGFVVIRNALNYQQILLEAYAQWQAENARVAKNEVLLLAGSCLFLTLSLYARNIPIAFLNLLGLGASLGGLIITQSRGYWLALVFSYLMIFIFCPRKMKVKILVLATGLTTIGLLIAWIFFDDLLSLAIKGLSMRLETVGELTSGQIDASLKERVWESADIIRFISHNPVAGYGFGVEYQRYSVLANYFFHYMTAYVHNGYLAVWYKFGVAGIGIFLTYIGSLILYTYRLYKSEAPQFIKAISLAILGTLFGMLVVNNTSPQFYAFDSMLLLMLIGVLISHYYQNYVVS